MIGREQSRKYCTQDTDKKVHLLPYSATSLVPRPHQAFDFSFTCGEGLGMRLPIIWCMQLKWVVHGKKVDIIILTHNYYVSNAGVVTYMSRVEAFATRIKIESRDQGDLRTAKN